ncbi:MAG: amidinotransferase [Acidobacteria bacterium]|nr:amidinotransferase [Acidobacteriota bacterium]
MVAPLQRVAVREPNSDFADADLVAWNYHGRPDLEAARAEHAHLVDLIEASGAEVIRHEGPLPGLADSIYVHDPVLVCDAGTIVLQMGKELRRGEEEPLAATLEAVGVPIHYRLHGAATAEGGDLLWLDSRTLAVGQGFRTNSHALEQLREALAPLGVECVPVPLPVFTGSAACLHLMSLISMLDDDLAVAYPSLLPVPFWQLLQGRGIEVVEVPESEFASQGPNVLALSPRRCVALEDNTETAARLEAAGCEVLNYRGAEISHKGEGGATCLTRPVLRA